MMTYEYTSALPPSQLRTRIAVQTRPWSRIDIWTAHNTFFSREKKSGDIRIVRTGPMRGYVYADLKLLEVGEGTRVSVIMGVPKTLYALDGAACLFFAVYLGIQLYRKESVMPFLLCVWAPVFLLWMTGCMGEELPRLQGFLEEELLLKAYS